MSEKNSKKTVAVRISLETEKQLKWLKLNSVAGFSLSLFIEHSILAFASEKGYKRNERDL